MIKNIQKNLLLCYPTIWNTKLVPALLVLLCVHLIAFAIGYIYTNNSIGEYFYNDNLYITTFCAILVCILLLIAWLVLYNKNNPIKYFYPRKTSNIYIEWLLVFIICSSIALVPVTLQEGGRYKWRSSIDLEGAKENLRLINKARILLPNNSSYYSFDEYSNSTIEAITADLDTHNNDTSLEYTGRSLLYYRYHNESYDFRDTEEDIKQVKQWLIKGDKDKITDLLTDYNSLLAIYGLEPISIEGWFDLLYNPPYFPVPDDNRAINQHLNKKIHSDYYYDSNGILKRGFTQVIEVYTDKKEVFYSVIFALSVAMACSILIYTYRITGKKQWLATVIITGVIAITYGLLYAFMNEVLHIYDSESFLFMWLLTFIGLLVYLGIKVFVSQVKGNKVGISLNMCLWILSFILPIVYFLFLKLINHYSYSYDDDKLYGWYYKMRDHRVLIFLINIIFLSIIMYPVSAFVKRFKGIAEE